jgi:hypothetical protein
VQGTLHWLIFPNQRILPAATNAAFIDDATAECIDHNDYAAAIRAGCFDEISSAFTAHITDIIAAALQ